MEKTKQFAQVNFVEIEENKAYIDFVQEILRQAFIKEKINNLNLSVNVILTNAENIKEINKKYRQIDASTDVLSFPIFEKEEIKELMQKGNIVEEILGDIVISIPQVEKQAIEYGHSFEREFAYMLVHGFYHLMGYDHIKEEDQKVMRAKEEELLEQLKITRTENSTV